MMLSFRVLNWVWSWMFNAINSVFFSLRYNPAHLAADSSDVKSSEHQIVFQITVLFRAQNNLILPYYFVRQNKKRRTIIFFGVRFVLQKKSKSSTNSQTSSAILSTTRESMYYSTFMNKVLCFIFSL